MAGVKARVATMLSLTGVLVAGSAAALVNTQVLRGTAPAGNTVSQLVEVSEDASSTSEVQVVTTPAPSSSATSTSTPEADDVKVYEVQNTGRVTLDTSKDVLRVVAVEPIAPWKTMSTRQVDPLTVQIRFVDGEAVVVFTANLMFGEISTNVGLESLAGPVTSTGGTTGGSTGGTSGGSTATSTDNTSATSNTTGGSTPTSVDDNDDDSQTSTSVDDGDGSGSGKGDNGGGGGGDDDHPDDDD